MTLVKMLGVAVALQLVAAPAIAQVTSDKNENAHHYQGGPKTVVPHSMKHPKSTRVRPLRVAALVVTTIVVDPRVNSTTWAITRTDEWRLIDTRCRRATELTPPPRR